jgi:hypothetical protein
MLIPSPRVLRFLVAVIAVASVAASAFGQVPSSTWVRLNLQHSPQQRAACAMAYDPVSQKIVMFGGYGPLNYFGDTWTFDGTDWTKQTTPIAPSPRAAAGLAFDSKLQKLVLFGGWNGQNYLGDTWVWDGATSTWTPMTPAAGPQPMTSPMLFPDPGSGRVDSFGGYDGRFYSLTTYRWRNGNWRKQSPPQSPSARSAAVLATDPVRKQTVVFGGLADVNPVNTWTFDGHTWTQQFPNNQLSYRVYSGAAYDPRFQGVVVFGGFSGADVNDTWLWTGSDWTQLNPAAAPTIRDSFGMAFDEALQQTVIFGGQSTTSIGTGSLLQDTWVLQTN